MCLFGLYLFGFIIQFSICKIRRWTLHSFSIPYQFSKAHNSKFCSIILGIHLRIKMNLTKHLQSINLNIQINLNISPKVNKSDSSHNTNLDFGFQCLLISAPMPRVAFHHRKNTFCTPTIYPLDWICLQLLPFNWRLTDWMQNEFRLNSVRLEILIENLASHSFPSNRFRPISQRAKQKLFPALFWKIRIYSAPKLISNNLHFPTLII